MGVVVKTKRTKHEDGRKTFSAEIRTELEPDDAWAVMADTQRLNEVVFQLAPTELLSTTPAQALAKTKLGPLSVEYDELAWSFDAPVRFQSTRLFHNGPLKRLDVEVLIMRSLEPPGRVVGPAGAVIHYSATITCGGPLGLAAEIVLMAKLEGAMPRLQAVLEKSVAGGGLGVDSTMFPPKDSGAIAARATTYAADAKALDPASSSRVDKLVALISRATENDVARLRPYAVARRWSEDKATTLALFLRAAKAGLLVMRWDVLCPSCSLPVSRVDEVSQLHKEGRCTSCGVAFDVNLHSNVEAAFAPLPYIRAAEAAVYCLGSPRETAHWLSQVTVGAGDALPLKQHLSLGRYRVQAAGLDKSTVVDVGPTGDTSARVELGSTGAVAVRAGDVELRLVNGGTDARRAHLAHERFAEDAATAAHVVALPLWRELFNG